MFKTEKERKEYRHSVCKLNSPSFYMYEMIDSPDKDKYPDIKSYLNKNFVAHFTTSKNLEHILKEGYLKPRISRIIENDGVSGIDIVGSGSETGGHGPEGEYTTSRLFFVSLDDNEFYHNTYANNHESQKKEFGAVFLFPKNELANLSTENEYCSDKGVEICAIPPLVSKVGKEKALEYMAGLSEILKQNYHANNRNKKLAIERFCQDNHINVEDLYSKISIDKSVLLISYNGKEWPRMYEKDGSTSEIKESGAETIQDYNYLMEEGFCLDNKKAKIKPKYTIFFPSENVNFNLLDRRIHENEDELKREDEEQEKLREENSIESLFKAKGTRMYEKSGVEEIYHLLIK